MYQFFWNSYKLSWLILGSPNFGFYCRDLLQFSRCVSHFRIHTFFLICFLWLSLFSSQCSSVDCRKCKNQFGNIDCGLARFCSTRAGRMNPECIKNCSDRQNCYQECVKGKKTCSKCCNWSSCSHVFFSAK